MHLVRVYTLLLGISLAGCQSKQPADSLAHTYTLDSSAHTTPKPQAVANLENRILAIHDSVMPAMSELIRLKKQVAQRQTELDKQPASTQIGEQKAQGQQVSVALAEADESMMAWMHQYKGDTLTKLTEQQAITYLKDQELRVKAMSEQMRQSITDARAYLQ